MSSSFIHRSYRHTLLSCLKDGTITPSRVGGMDSLDVGQTTELRDLTFEFTPGDEFYRPGYSRKLAVLEALHLLAGTFDADHFKAVAPKVGSGMFTAQMAYGPRVQPHLERVSRELVDNPHSRRAVVFVSDNGSWPPPCTNSIQWLIRQGRLETIITMRSWDLWLGLPYDLFMFGAVSLAMAGALSLPLGRARVHAASAHLYEKHWDRVREAVFTTLDDSPVGMRAGQFDLTSREWSRMGDVSDLHRYWNGVQRVADRYADLAPWSNTWTDMQKMGLIQFREVR